MPWSSSVEQCGDLWGGGCEEDQTGVKRSSATQMHHIFEVAKTQLQYD